MNQRGYSLIELIIVIVLIGILASTIIPRVNKFQQKNKQLELKAYTKVLKKTMRQYYALEGKYPDDLMDLKGKGYKIIIDTNQYKYAYDPTNPNDLTVEYK
ncbi:prepilin-type N-terminal cleavage/methylation domain-containing protein [Crassaminicella profunda]|uniref:prepilin-type N-terminal cleavage/methylation domain-containing protein n=1 Tax=Crassaminicella profunda TaxID=1286698 RepID=UPI001CA74322|nr:prepilin-type N-terminal cleavage/methylation domain-containing protein [Crassaminicella profunda]QZY55258.1 prepilin-type N-terminal cleavage/methylation domain-containing protein [Crassaminicella profunda]